MLAHVAPSAFSRTMSATTAQRLRPDAVLALVFGGVAGRPLKAFRPARHSCHSEPDGSGERVSLGLLQAEPRSDT